MNVIVGLSYIFIGLSCLYQIWQTFVGVSIGMEVFKLKHDWSMILVDILIALLCSVLFIISVYSILFGITVLLGGTLLTQTYLKISTALTSGRLLL